MFRVILLAACVLFWGVNHAKASPQKRTIYSVVTGFFVCMMEKTCPEQDLIHGKDSKRNLERMRKRKAERGVKVIVAYLTSGIVSKRFHKHMERLGKDLQGAGYDTHEISKLGREKAIVRLGPSVAIASSAAMYLRPSDGKRRRSKVEHFFTILWKIPKLGWRVVFVEDFPQRWMARNKPPQMQGK